MARSRSPLVGYVLAFLLVGSALAASTVLDLLPSNFDSIVLNSKKPALVEFFAPWCGHCKQLAPVYEELAQSFAHASDKVSIAKVDADEHKSLGKRFGVQGFPTLKWFDGTSDKAEDYSGGRDLESLSNFVAKKTGLPAKTPKPPPSSVRQLSDTDFSKTVGGEQHVLVAFTAPWCGHCKSLAPTWESLAADYAQESSIVIAKVDAEAENSKATAKSHGVTSYPTIKFFEKGSSNAEAYNGGRSAQDFVTFLNDKAGTYRTVGGGLNAQAGTIAALDELVSKISSGQEAAVDEVGKAAQGLKDKYAEYYVKVAGKAKKSKDYATTELKRLEGLLKKGGLAPVKRDDVTSRSNILRKFVGQPAEETQAVKDEL